jgi:hypothetical protein
VTSVVEDVHGVTHEVVLQPTRGRVPLAGATTCNARFFVEPEPYRPAYTIGAVRMARSDAEVTCMACIAEHSNYDEA